MLLNDGGHQHHGRGPVDWVYVAGHERELERWSGVPEPGRVLVTVIAAMQSIGRRSDRRMTQGLAAGSDDRSQDDGRCRSGARPSRGSRRPSGARLRRHGWVPGWRSAAVIPLVTYFHLANCPAATNHRRICGRSRVARCGNRHPDFARRGWTRSWSRGWNCGGESTWRCRRCFNIEFTSPGSQQRVLRAPAASKLPWHCVPRLRCE